MLKRGQTGFGSEGRFNTFGEKQNAIYSTTKANKISEALILKQKGGDAIYFKGILLNKNYLLSNMITLNPNGKFTISKNK
jgi:hypothetical protein